MDADERDSKTKRPQCTPIEGGAESMLIVSEGQPMRRFLNLR